MNFKAIRRKLGNWISGDSYTYVNYVIPIEYPSDNYETLRISTQIENHMFELFKLDIDSTVKWQLLESLAKELVDKTKYTTHYLPNCVEYRMEVKIIK